MSIFIWKYFGSQAIFIGASHSHITDKITIGLTGRFLVGIFEIFGFPRIRLCSKSRNHGSIVSEIPKHDDTGDKKRRCAVLIHSNCSS